MRYSRMATPPPRKKRKFANLVLVAVILGIAIYLVTAGAAGNWLADNIINPVFNNGIAAAATPSKSISPSVSPTATAATASTSPSDTPASSGRVEDQITAQEITLYTLQAGAFSDKANAETTASAIKSQGGAGFVVFDSNLYKVLVAGYTDQNNANDVKTSLKNQGVNASIFVLKSGTVTFKIGAQRDQIDAIKECIDEVPDSVSTLQKIIFNADKGQNVDSDLASLKEKAAGIKDDLNNAVSSDETAVKSLKDYMDKFCAAINGLPASSSPASAFSSGLKYALIQIVTDYSSFLKSLAG